MAANPDSIDTRMPGLAGLYRALWKFAEGKRPLIFVSSALLLGSQFAKLAEPWLAGQAINALQRGGLDGLPEAGLFLAAIFGVTVLSWALHGPGRIIERSVAIAVRSRLSDQLYARLVSLPLAWHEGHHSGELLHRVNRSTDALFGFAQSQFLYLQNGANLVGPVIALFVLSAATGATALVGYALIAVAIVRFDAVMMQLAAAENQAERRFSAALVDTLGNASTILALRLGPATRGLVARRLEAVFEPLKRSIVVNESKWCVVDLLNTALWCVLLALYAWLSARDGETPLIGNLFMVYQYAQQAGGVIVSMASNYQEFARHQADYASANPIWDAAPHEAPKADPVRPGWREIEVQGLSFSHPRRRHERPSLEHVDLRLRRGERIALVGESGSGKSTLLRVLRGLYTPEVARVDVDGRPAAGRVDVAEIAALIPQDPEVFEGTLRENLTLGEERSDAELREACRLALFDSVVDTLPAGLDTPITERGLNFSGGQKQRLALARGLVAARGSAVLLLDEPTASLDPVTEARVYENLFAAFPDTCIVSSIHRLHLLDRFDRIVLMAEGHVVDQGTVAELERRQPLFRQMRNRALSGGTPAT